MLARTEGLRYGARSGRTKYLHILTFAGILYRVSIRDQEATAVFRKYHGVLRMSDALRAGVSRRTLYRLRDQGVIEPLSRGVYRLASLPALTEPDLVTVATRVPEGVICLISALAFHGLTTQIPRAVDVAVPRGTEPPRLDYPPINLYWRSGPAFEEGIVEHRLDGQRVRIYSPEKSVADIFQYRNKLGLDVALEALKTWRAGRGANTQRLLDSARACRVERAIRPYLEAIA